MRQGLAQAAAVAALDPADSAGQMELASLHGQHSDLLSKLGEREASVRQLDTAIALLEAVVAREPDNVPAGRGLSTGYSRRGEVHLEQDRTPASSRQALAYFQRAQRVLQPLVARHPDNTTLARNLAFAHQLQGETQLRLGQAAQAVENQREAMRAFTHLADADPADQQSRIDLLHANEQLSLALQAQGDLPAAVAAARQAVAMAEHLPAMALANTETRLSQGKAHYALAQALARQAAAPGGSAAQHAEACAQYRPSLPIIEDMRLKLPHARLSLDPAMVQAALQRCAG